MDPQTAAARAGRTPFASDPERLARFEREGKTLASLNHAHIAAIHAVEKSAGRRALVRAIYPGSCR